MFLRSSSPLIAFSSRLQLSVSSLLSLPLIQSMLLVTTPSCRLALYLRLLLSSLSFHCHLSSLHSWLQPLVAGSPHAFAHPPHCCTLSLFHTTPHYSTIIAIFCYLSCGHPVFCYLSLSSTDQQQTSPLLHNLSLTRTPSLSHSTAGIWSDPTGPTDSSWVVTTMAKY